MELRNATMYERSYLDLEDELDTLEAEYGCPMEKIPEDGLIELVERFSGDEAATAKLPAPAPLRKPPPAPISPTFAPYFPRTSAIPVPRTALPRRP